MTTSYHTTQAPLTPRIPELDYLKGILILHVILIHLVFLGESHPQFKEFILHYTTPAFFVISGYLAHVNKPLKPFAKKVFWWAIPYIIMESGYIVMASILPIKEHISHLSLTVFAQHLFLQPLGPYWYIHNLICCYIGYYIFDKFTQKRNLPWTIHVRIAGIFAFFLVLYAASPESCLFFVFGILIHSTKKIGFMGYFIASILSIPLLALCYVWKGTAYLQVPDFFYTCVTTYFAIGFLLYLHQLIPEKISDFIGFIGRNTLAILLFSPMFTILTKYMVPLFRFDSTCILFALVSVSFTTAGCLSIARLLDWLKLSPYFCGTKHFFKK